MSRTGQHDWRGALGGLLAWTTFGGAAATAFAAGIPEPATVFYGRITGTGSAQSFLVTEGELRVTIRQADGTTFPLSTKLWPVNDGQFSYRLDIPQQALSLGLQTDSGILPVKSGEETHAIAEILVSGVRARVVGNSSAVFKAAQARRASTQRMDLEVALLAPDTDRDGLPDWWERKYGGDLAADGDANGDGRSNLAEYLGGTDPLADSRKPSIVTRELTAYADLTTGMRLVARDSDTPPEKLVFTLTQPPAGAEVRLRNFRPDAARPDLSLSTGDTFTQRDVLDGRLTLVHAGGATEATTIGLRLSDGTAGAVGATSSVQVSFFRPAVTASGEVLDPESLEGRRHAIYQLARSKGAIVWDGLGETADLVLRSPGSGLSAQAAVEYAQQFGPDRPQLLIGGPGRDTLTGGLADDVLEGGAGDNTLTGGVGADRFVIGGGGGGTDTIADFRPDDGDVIDLDNVLHGLTGKASDHLRLVSSPSGLRLEVRQNADAASAVVRTVVLPGLVEGQVDLDSWLDQGSLAVGGLAASIRVGVVASHDTAGENGPRSGEFLLNRSGNASHPLAVRLAIKGSAVNGVDYASVPESISFAAGQREARIRIAPYADSQSEPAESVELSVEPGDGYEPGSSNRATVSIIDLLPVVRAEALDRLAIIQGGAPATLLISRDTVIDRSVLVRIDIRGSAAGGSDIQSLPRFVNLLPGQTTALLSVTPVTGGANAGGTAKTVLVSVVPDGSYIVSGAKEVEMLVVPERTTFAAWRARNFPGVAGPIAAFAATDPGAKGVPAILRYAFALDPQHPDETRLPRAVVRDGHLTLDAWRQPGAGDVEFAAEISPDMVSWSASPDMVERVFAPENAANPEFITFRSVKPVAEGSKAFLRLRVKLQP